MIWFITDIDGTITDSNGQLYLPAIREIQSLGKAGILVGLVSGRPYPIVRMLGDYLGLRGPLIAENGGSGFFNDKKFVLGSRRVAEKAIELLRSLIPLEQSWDNSYRETDYALNVGVDIQKLQEILTQNEIEAEVQVSSIMVHIAKKGVTKSAGIKHCLRLAGLEPTGVTVAGDSESDISLFEDFPMSIAPANCTEPIGRLARFRADLGFGEGFCQGIDYLRRIEVLP